MTKRPTVGSLAAVLTASAALLLTACGGSSPAKPSEQITGAQPPAPTSATPSAGAADTAHFTIPADIKTYIEADTTGDKDKDAVLRAQADALLARQQLYADLDPQSPLLFEYFTGDARSTYAEDVRKAKQQGWTITGTYRYFNRKVISYRPTSAAVSYCEDQSKGYGKELKTGKVDVTAPSPDDHLLTTQVLDKSASGVWQVSAFSSQKGAAQCE